MREIKFNAYDRNAKVYIRFDDWVKGESIEIYGDNVTSSEALASFMDFHCGCDLFQYIGLKDKNSVEIYEGDIVEDIYVGVCEVKCGIFNYEDEFGVSVMMSGFYLTNGKNNYGFGTDGDFEIEVIGNICENKELLC